MPLDHICCDKMRWIELCRDVIKPAKNRMFYCTYCLLDTFFLCFHKCFLHLYTGVWRNWCKGCLSLFYWHICCFCTEIFFNSDTLYLKSVRFPRISVLESWGSGARHKKIFYCPPNRLKWVKERIHLAIKFLSRYWKTFPGIWQYAGLKKIYTYKEPWLAS